MTTLSKLPPLLNLVSAWNSLPQDTRDAIGVLAIQRELLIFAAGEYQGDRPGEVVTYLNACERDVASKDEAEIQRIMAGIVADDLPDLFGQNPTPEHPSGTDPAWARPIVSTARRRRSRREVIVISEDRA